MGHILSEVHHSVQPKTMCDLVESVFLLDYVICLCIGWFVQLLKDVFNSVIP